MSHVQGISTAGVIHVVAMIVHQAIVRCVVDSPKTQGGSQLVSLSGMVVNNIDDDLDTFTMKVFTMVLNSATCSPRTPVDAGLRRKKPIELYPQ